MKADATLADAQQARRLWAAVPGVRVGPITRISNPALIPGAEARIMDHAFRRGGHHLRAHPHVAPRFCFNVSDSRADPADLPRGVYPADSHVAGLIEGL